MRVEAAGELLLTEVTDPLCLPLRLHVSFYYTLFTFPMKRLSKDNKVVNVCVCGEETFLLCTLHQTTRLCGEKKKKRSVKLI